MSDDPLADVTIAAAFSALAVAITYRPLLGPAVVVAAVPRVVDPLLAGLGGGQQLHDGRLLEVRAGELPAGSPGPGDQLATGGQTYLVRSWRPADGSRQVWLLDAVPA